MKGTVKNTLCSNNWTRLVLLILFTACVIALACSYIFFQGDILKEEIDDPDVMAQLMEMRITPDCDDGKTNLTVDWDQSSTAYTCRETAILADPQLVPEYYCETFPDGYKASHVCMSKPISYAKPVPTYGRYRPVWPVYGEYKYLPVQRWLRSLELGAIVVLYHPCTNPLEINVLRRVVKQCLRRYIISPSNLLDRSRSVALLSWGCKMTMSSVMESVVKQFIQRHALHGPEAFAGHRGFNNQLLEKSKVVSDYEDKCLCPGFMANEDLSEDASY